MKFFSRLLIIAAGAMLATASASAQDAGTVTATHGDWEVRCSSDAEKVCVMSQSYKDAEGRPIAFVKLLRLNDRSLSNGTKIPAQWEVVVPLGVVLTEGLSMQIDSKKARVAPYRFCVKAGCRVLEPITEGFVSELKGGANVVLAFQAIDGKKRQATISLNGFTKAYNELPPAN